MVTQIEADTLQGTLSGSVWFLLYLGYDILYLRDQSTMTESVFDEETPAGFTLFRTDSGQVAGLTIVNYWRRFGTGDLQSASIRAVRDCVVSSGLRAYQEA